MGLFGSVEVPMSTGTFPDISGLLSDISDRTLLSEVDSDLFEAALYTAGINPETKSDGSTWPMASIGFEDSMLWIAVAWERSGTTLMKIVTTNFDFSQAVSPMSFNLGHLRGILGLFEDPVRIFWADDNSVLLKLESGPFTVAIRPAQDGFQELRVRTESTITEVFGPDATLRDSDGDYQLKVTGTRIWGRLVATGTPELRVFSTLLTNVKASPELMAELNDINLARSFVRVAWIEDAVMAQAELVASTLDPAELFTAFERVNSAVSELTPMLAIAFGGESVDRDAERWTSYLSTIISAELSPEAIHNLNGGSGVKHWPFDAPIHVITAWNPYNIPRSQWENDHSNIDLGVELAKVGAKYAPATGTSSDGEHYEPGFVTWSLTRGEAIEIAKLFRQEAIFELTSDELRLVHCQTDQVDIAPRLSPGTPG